MASQTPAGTAGSDSTWTFSGLGQQRNGYSVRTSPSSRLPQRSMSLAPTSHEMHGGTLGAARSPEVNAAAGDGDEPYAGVNAGTHSQRQKREGQPYVGVNDGTFCQLQRRGGETHWGFDRMMAGPAQTINRNMGQQMNGTAGLSQNAGPSQSAGPDRNAEPSQNAGPGQNVDPGLLASPEAGQSQRARGEFLSCQKQCNQDDGNRSFSLSQASLQLRQPPHGSQQFEQSGGPTDCHAPDFSQGRRMTRPSQQLPLAGQLQQHHAQSQQLPMTNQQNYASSQLPIINQHYKAASQQLPRSSHLQQTHLPSQQLSALSQQQQQQQQTHTAAQQLRSQSQPRAHSGRLHQHPTRSTQAYDNQLEDGSLSNQRVPTAAEAGYPAMSATVENGTLSKQHLPKAADVAYPVMSAASAASQLGVFADEDSDDELEYAAKGRDLDLDLESDLGSQKEATPGRVHERYVGARHAVPIASEPSASGPAGSTTPGQLARRPWVETLPLQMYPPRLTGLTVPAGRSNTTGSTQSSHGLIGPDLQQASKKFKQKTLSGGESQRFRVLQSYIHTV